MNTSPLSRIFAPLAKAACFLCLCCCACAVGGSNNGSPKWQSRVVRLDKETETLETVPGLTVGQHLLRLSEAGNVLYVCTRFRNLYAHEKLSSPPHNLLFRCNVRFIYMIATIQSSLKELKLFYYYFSFSSIRIE